MKKYRVIAYSNKATEPDKIIESYFINAKNLRIAIKDEEKKRESQKKYNRFEIFPENAILPQEKFKRHCSSGIKKELKEKGYINENGDMILVKDFDPVINEILKKYENNFPESFWKKLFRRSEYLEPDLSPDSVEIINSKIE